MTEAERLRTADHTQSIQITNHSKEVLSLHLEPWGDEFLLQPMECIKVAIIGSERKAIPVSYTGDSIIIDAWEGTTAEVWKGTERLN